MNYNGSKYEISYSRKMEASFAIIILLASVMLIGVPALMPAAHAAKAGTLTLSHDKLWGNSTIRILVSDADIGLGSDVGPVLTVKVGTGSELTLNSTQLNDGDWVAYLTDGGTVATHGSSAIPLTNFTAVTGTNGVLTGTAAKARIQNPGTHAAGRYASANNSAISDGFIQVENFTRWTSTDETITIKYRDLSDADGAITDITDTFKFQENKATISNYNTNIVPGGMLWLAVTDADKNHDPTKKDEFQVTNATTLKFSIGFSTNATLSGLDNQTLLEAGTTLTFTENGTNTNIFDATSFNSSTLRYNNTGSSTGPGVLLTETNHTNWNHLDELKVTFTVPDIEISSQGRNSTSVTLPIHINRGTLTLDTTTFTHSDDVTATVTDFDANRDPKVKDTILIVISNGTTSVVKTATEDGKNSSQFDAKLKATIGALSALSTSAATVVPGANPTITWTYNDTKSPDALSIANAQATHTTTAVTTSLDKASYDVNELEAKFTFTEPDANDNAKSLESLYLNSSLTSTSGVFLGTTASGVRIANFSVVVIKDTGVEHIKDFSAIVREADKDGGVWVATINMTDLSLVSGDSLRVFYKDLFDAVTVNATATIGGTLAVIEFDRTSIPVVPGFRTNTTVTVTDVDANVNPNAIDTLRVRFVAKNGTGEVVGQSQANIAADATSSGTIRSVHHYNLTLTETGQDTGKFNEKFFIFWGPEPETSTPGQQDTVVVTLGNYSSATKELIRLDRLRDMISGSITIEVTDGLSTSTLTPEMSGTAGPKGVAGSISIGSNDATITVNSTNVNLGDTLLVTVTDADQNLDPAVKDTFSVRFQMYTGITVPVTGTTPKTNTTITVKETAVDSGVFEKAGIMGTGSAPYSNINASMYIKVKVMDDSTSASFTGGSRRGSDSASVVVGSATATLSTSPASASGPYATVTVTMVDPDLAYNKTNVLLTQVATEKSSDVEDDILATGGTRSNGTWTFKFKVNGTGSATQNDDVVTVNASDVIHVFMTDSKDAAGKIRIIESIITISVADGVITTDKSAYNIGEKIAITITDADRNTDSAKVERLRPVVKSDSWLLGKNVTLTETGIDTGIFTGKVEVISGAIPADQQILAAIGDTITIKYIDILGKDAARRTLEITVKIGTATPKTQQVPAGDPTVVDQNGNALALPTVGDVVTIQASVTNNDTASHTFTFLVQIKSSSGEVVNLAWIRDLTLSAGQSTTPGVAWIPDVSGTYTAEVFVWESIADPIALSPVKSVTFTVRA